MVMKYRFIVFILLVGLGGLLLWRWQKPPKVITEVRYETKTDTIRETIIEEKPITRYVERIKTVRGRDTIIYREVPTDSSIEANEYRTEVKADSATAKLKILTTGELLDVKGTITYPKEIKTITRYQNASGLFLSGQTDTKLQNFGVGLDYVFKNTIIVGVSANHNTAHSSSYVGVKLGIKIK